MTCDIELKIGRGSAPGQYRVQVVHAEAGGEPESTLALDVEGLLARRDELERVLLASSVPHRSATTTADQAVQQVGEELFRSLFHGPVSTAYAASLGVAQQRGERLRVVLRLTEPELAGLPWEMLYDSVRHAHLCLEEPIVRRISAPFVMEALNVRPPLRVLGLIASPRPLPALDVEAEIARLTEAVHDVVEAGLVKLDWVKKATWANVQGRLMSGEWHVVHFIGHGDYDRQRGGLLALESDEGRLHLVEASQLAHLLGEAQPSPRLVVLNSCSGGEVGKEDLFSGTASTLIHRGIDAVAAMQFAVSDQAAIAFARGFYTAIAAGRGVDEAVGSGRVAILGIPDVRTLEWATPVLYLRGNITHPIKVERPNGSTAPSWLESERLYDEALAELRLGRPESAVRHFRRLLDHDPDYQDAAELLEQAELAVTLQPVYDDAVAALDHRDPQRALELLDQLLEQSPGHRPANGLRQRALHEQTAQVLLERADDNLRRGNTAAALGALNDLDQHAPGYPGSAELRLRAQVFDTCQPGYDRAVAALGSGDYEAAARDLRRVLDVVPNYRDAAELCERAERAVALRPTYAAAERALDHGNPEESLALIDEILTECPIFREAAVLRQRVVHALAAQALFDRVGRMLDRGDAAGALALLDGWDEQGAADPAAAALREPAKVMLECQPLYDEAVTALDRRDYKAAIVLLDRVLELDPDYRDAVALRGGAARELARRRRALVLAGGGLVGAALVALAWFLLRGPSTLSDNDLVLSIDGERLVAVDAESGDVREIDTDGGDVVQPNPSPDRSSVVYLAKRADDDDQREPRLVGVDGSDDRSLLRGNTPCPGRFTKAPGWSPDGDRLALVCAEDDADGRGTALYTVTATGSDPILVLSADDQEDLGPPTWSSSGLITLWLGGLGQDPGHKGGELIVVDPARPGVSDSLTHEKDAHPDWDDEDRLVFVRRGDDDDGAEDQIMVLDYAEFQRDATPVVGPPLATGFVNYPTWSPDGGRIAYLKRDQAGSPYRLWVMNANGSDAHPVDLPDAPTALNWGTR